MKDLLVRLDPIAREFGFYTSYELSEHEFMGEVKTIDDDNYNYLKYHLPTNAGYEKPPKAIGVPLEAAKIHPTWGEVHDYSLRKVDQESPRWQYHVHVWEREKWSEIFSHYELRPDFRRINGESWNKMYDRLREHYRPDWGETYIRGKACGDVEALVE